MASSTQRPWIAAVLCAVGAAAMSVAAWITGMPAIVPSLGASIVLAAADPRDPEAAPVTMAAGHAIAVAAALATLALLGLLDAPSALVAGVGAARMLAVPVALAATFAGMALVGRVHAPAGATALLVACGIFRAGGDVAVLAATTVCLAAVVAGFPRLAARLGGGAPPSRPARRRRPAARRAR